MCGCRYSIHTYLFEDNILAGVFVRPLIENVTQYQYISDPAFLLVSLESSR